METIRSRSHFNKLTFCGIMLICLMFFSSCENFLNGGKVRDEILDTVAYNNAPESTVFFSAQDKMGSFLVTGRQTLKLGYEWQVQFTVNTQDYVFECLEAVSSEDSSKSLADFVSFRTIKEDAQRGIYTINVKLIKQAKDILIRPKCKQLPKIEQITPAFESYGCYQSKPIKITFNKALNEESFNNTYKTILSEYSETVKMSISS